MFDEYPDDWDQRRKEVYKRDGYTCQRCGVKGGPYGDNEIHAHHKIPISDGGSNRLQNLITVCKQCHEDIHGHKIPTGSETSATESSSSLIDLLFGESNPSREDIKADPSQMDEQTQELRAIYQDVADDQSVERTESGTAKTDPSRETGSSTQVKTAIAILVVLVLVVLLL